MHPHFVTTFRPLHLLQTCKIPTPVRALALSAFLPLDPCMSKDRSKCHLLTDLNAGQNDAFLWVLFTWVNAVSNKNSCSWLGDKSVHKARGAGTNPTFPLPLHHSVPHLFGPQHPMPGSCSFTLSWWELCLPRLSASRSLYVCWQQSRNLSSIQMFSVDLLSDTARNSEFISTHIPYPLQIPTPGNHNPIYIKSHDPRTALCPALCPSGLQWGQPHI